MYNTKLMMFILYLHTWKVSAQRRQFTPCKLDGLSIQLYFQTENDKLYPHNIYSWF